jgi:hypothetical protein
MADKSAFEKRLPVACCLFSVELFFASVFLLSSLCFYGFPQYNNNEELTRSYTEKTQSCTEELIDTISLKSFFNAL